MSDSVSEPSDDESGKPRITWLGGRGITGAGGGGGSSRGCAG